MEIEESGGEQVMEGRMALWTLMEGGMYAPVVAGPLLLIPVESLQIMADDHISLFWTDI